MGLFGGASSADKALARDSKNFMDAMQNYTATAFQGQQAALDAVRGGWSPIIAGGANQYGFSVNEDQTLRSDIVNQGATATANTVAAEQLRQQQESGGASVLPSGSSAALEEQARQRGAQATAGALSKEKELGYQVGREEFNTAQAGMSEVAKIENPSGLGGAAVGAGEAAQKAQTAVDTANANSLGAKLLGGAITGGLSLATGGLGGLATGEGFATGAGNAMQNNPFQI